MLDQENVESSDDNWTDNPNGTGPFRLREYERGARIILERNESYYREPARLDTVQLNLAGDLSISSYENGEVDVISVGQSDLERISDSEDLKKELIVAPANFSITHFAFNTNKPPFDDVKFRQALNHAVDKEFINSEIFSGLLEPAGGILPPGFPGHNPALEGLKFNPELARKLLSESKYSDPETRPVIVVTGPGISLDADAVIDSWRQVLGVEAEFQQVAFGRYLQGLAQKEYQATAGSWIADYPDPHSFLDVPFHSESSLNFAAYSRPEVDELLEKARVEQDFSRRFGLYREAESIIVNDAAWLPLWYGNRQHALVKPYVKGFKLTPIIIPVFKHIYLRIRAASH